MSAELTVMMSVITRPLMVHDSAIGSHPVQQHGDVMKMQLRGPLTEADVAGMQSMVLAIRDEQGSCFLIADVHGLTGIDADARRMMAHWGRAFPEARAAGVAVYGVSFAMRTLITLTINAVRLLGYREVELVFLRDELEASRWIAEQRAALVATPEPA